MSSKLAPGMQRVNTLSHNGIKLVATGPTNHYLGLVNQKLVVIDSSAKAKEWADKGWFDRRLQNHRPRVMMH